MLGWSHAVFLRRLQQALANALGKSVRKAEPVDLNALMVKAGLDKLFPVATWPSVTLVCTALLVLCSARVTWWCLCRFARLPLRSRASRKGALLFPLSSWN